MSSVFLDHFDNGSSLEAGAGTRGLSRQPLRLRPGTALAGRGQIYGYTHAPRSSVGVCQMSDGDIEDTVACKDI